MRRKPKSGLPLRALEQTWRASTLFQHDRSGPNPAQPQARLKRPPITRFFPRLTVPHGWAFFIWTGRRPTGKAGRAARRTESQRHMSSGVAMLSALCLRLCKHETRNIHPIFKIIFEPYAQAEPSAQTLPCSRSRLEASPVPQIPRTPSTIPSLALQYAHLMQ